MDNFKAWLNKQLVDDWQKALNFSSVRFGLYGGTLVSVWAALSDEQKASVLSLVGIDVKWLVPIGILVAIGLRLKRES